MSELLERSSQLDALEDAFAAVRSGRDTKSMRAVTGARLATKLPEL